MPRKSIYFTDELLPRALAAAELDDRSLSAWLMLAVEARLDAMPPREPHVCPEDGLTCHWGPCPPAHCERRAARTAAPVSSPDADVLRAASAAPKSTPKPEEYTSVMAERQRAMEVQRAKSRKAGS